MNVGKSFRALGGALLFWALVGCTPTLIVGGGPITAESGTVPSGAVRYWLTKSVVVVDATVTKEITGKIVITDNGDTMLKTRGPEIKETNLAVTMQSMPVTDELFYLHVAPGSMSDQDFTIDLTPSGTLKGIGLKSTGQAGAILKSAATIVGTALAVAAVIALDEPAEAGRAKAVKAVCDQFVENSAADADAHKMAGGGATDKKGGAGKTQKPDVTPAPAEPPFVGEACEKVLAAVSAATLHYLSDSDTNRQLWLRNREAVSRKERRVEERLSVQQKITSLAKPEREEAKERLALVNVLLDAEQKDAATATTALEESIKAFDKKNHIGSETTQQKLHFVFDLEQIAPPDLLAAASDAGMAEEDVRGALKNYKELAAFYDATGAVLTLTPKPKRSDAQTDGATANGGKATVYYRQSYKAVLGTYVTVDVPQPQGKPPSRLLRFSAAQINDVVNPQAPLSVLVFSPSDFVERSLSVTFDESGKLVKVQQGGKSEGAAAATALESLSDVTTKFSGALSTLSTIQSTQRTINQDATLDEIDRLQKQKLLLEAQKALADAQKALERPSTAPSVAPTSK